jgi:hypothetical protein
MAARKCEKDATSWEMRQMWQMSALLFFYRKEKQNKKGGLWLILGFQKYTTQI